MASRGWERDRESRTRVASVVANASREVESRKGVANVSREWGRECESRNGVANVSRENKKIGAYVNEGPEGSNYLNKK